MHHDHLKVCEDRCFPVWLKRLRHSLLGVDSLESLELQDLAEEPPADLDVSLAQMFGEAEQESDSEGDPLAGATALVIEEPEGDSERNTEESLGTNPTPTSEPMTGNLSSEVSEPVRESGDVSTQDQAVGAGLQVTRTERK